VAASRTCELRETYGGDGTRSKITNSWTRPPTRARTSARSQQKEPPPRPCSVAGVWRPRLSGQDRLLAPIRFYATACGVVAPILVKCRTLNFPTKNTPQGIHT
jgi:hypothetical protein